MNLSGEAAVFQRGASVKERKTNCGFSGTMCRLIILAGLYSFAHLMWYHQTPLGQTPVLDGAENIHLADAIFKGGLSREPFYRAMLYPAFLSLFRFIGFSVEELHGVAGIIGIYCHLLNAILVGFLAFRIWRSEKASYTAVLIYSLYPVAIHFASDPFDITPAMTLMLASVILFFDTLEQDSWKYALATGILLGLSVSARPNILPLIFAFQLVFLIRRRYKSILLVTAGLISILLIVAMINYHRSGQFRILPWQSGFSLYAANMTGANGKYFRQSMILPDRELIHNPARYESEIIYARKTGRSQPFSIDEFNDFWRKQTVETLKNDPWNWLRLMVKKLYYLLNNFEQYNNKTYGFHKAKSPILRFNPLCWGILLVFAVVAVAGSERTPELCVTFACILFLSAGILLFFVSARFRLLLVPFIAALASGCVKMHVYRLKSYRLLLFALVPGFIAFSGYANVADISTYDTDRLLMAHACARLNDYYGQVSHADEVLKNQPDNPLAARIKLAGFTNLVLSGEPTDHNSWNMISNELRVLSGVMHKHPDIAFIAGCHAYSVLNDRARAWELWNAALEKAREGREIFTAALILTGGMEPDQQLSERKNDSALLWYSLYKAGMVVDEPPEVRTLDKICSFLFHSNE